MKYSEIIYLQDDRAIEVLDILNEHGEEKAFEYLMQWYTGEEPIQDDYDVPWGKYDKQYRKDNFVMTYNRGLCYIGLNKIYTREEL